MLESYNIKTDFDEDLRFEGIFFILSIVFNDLPQPCKLKILKKLLLWYAFDMFI